MLRKIRITLAMIFFIGITLLFLDFTGVIHAWLGWMAKVQLLPAVMALNLGVIVTLIVLTLLLGRVYCSVICPLGVMQDLFGWMGKKQKKNRYTYSLAKNKLRYAMLIVMIVSIIFGIGSIVALFAPYSSYGRIAQNLFSPIWNYCNNLLAEFAVRHESYAFYSVDVWIRSGMTFGIAIVTFVVLGILAWRNGRTYCNTICPVGTILGFLSKYSLFKPVIDTSKCNGCGLCARNCKASCIDSKNHKIDYSRCVACMDCIGKCRKNAISYSRGKVNIDKQLDTTESVGSSRRNFLTTTIAIGTTTVLHSEEKTVDGGLAVITDKKIPVRKTQLVPPGAISLRHLTKHCTGCQLCVAACPNGVLRPSSDLDTLMQPRSSYERGYCRPECTKCSEVCPAGAIIKLDRSEKSSVQIGHAVWVKNNCVPLTDGVECGNCARHCPVSAIQMIPPDKDNPDSPKIPVVNDERCIGCGACENLCPARPFSAIYVEGHENHRII
jgi:ferredoxin